MVSLPALQRNRKIMAPPATLGRSAFQHCAYQNSVKRTIILRSKCRETITLAAVDRIRTSKLARIHAKYMDWSSAAGSGLYKICEIGFTPLLKFKFHSLGLLVFVRGD